MSREITLAEFPAVLQDAADDQRSKSQYWTAKVLDTARTTIMELTTRLNTANRIEREEFMKRMAAEKRVEVLEAELFEVNGRVAGLEK